jgi:hypothetical protein
LEEIGDESGWLTPIPSAMGPPSQNDRHLTTSGAQSNRPRN